MQNPLTHSQAALVEAFTRADAYLETIPDRSVAPTPDAISRLTEFDTPMPEQPSAPAKTIAMLDEIGSPATTASVGGRFYGLVVGGTLPAALGARVLASAWDQVVFNEATSPIGVKLERVASAWLLNILGLPKDCSVGFVTGATMANFTCLAAARNTLLERQGWDVSRKGLWGAPPVRIVAGRQVHVTVLKALKLLGFGTDEIEWVDCDAQGRMISAKLPDTDDRTLILTQSGNVNSGASDPIAEIVAAANDAWVHVDGAFGLWAAASPRTQAQLHGYDAADSWVTDGHKWLNTPYDCGMAICRHPDAIHNAMATQAPYLEIGGVAAPKDMVPEFSRGARGVEVWAALHSLGKEGVADLIDRSCALARRLAAGLQDSGFEILNDVVLNQVVATFPDFEGRSSDIAQMVQESGEAWFGATKWNGRPALRFSVASWATSDADIDRTLQAIKKTISSLA
ncbi:pyridoxal-dependent decarboxylase [Aliiroseovarius sp. KMU-50]|uniref:Pyridoxal-dependent decarboxylase n=1 Tax=Aliiroseovarius salicola TaxID=3009082 RepID=A0ABT4VX16_9RHOB|nr:pyridoxal-dependent decarboxylase [Aliiroseovarius sp. KMU-50]MDA5092784.1 pyridoxal-dependent decarboxylase [Aliiroseovarius sp. KMU-50]